jgi:hypothetical protein
MCPLLVRLNLQPSLRPIDDPDTKLGQDCFIVRDANGQALSSWCNMRLYQVAFAKNFAILLRCGVRRDTL